MGSLSSEVGRIPGGPSVRLPAPRARDYLPWLRAVRRAAPLRDPRIRYVRGQSIALHGTGIDWEVDGEYVGAGPLRISVLPRSLPFLLPRWQQRRCSSSGS